MNRKIPFVNEEFHHCFNRGVDKRPIFLDIMDYERYLDSMYLLNTFNDGLMTKWRDYKKYHPKVKPWDFKVIKPEERLVDILCYCLNENHYHKILIQLQYKGIETFMHKIGTSYSMYFNKKYKRSGSLCQGVFKSVYIETNDQLLYLSAYVNANHFIHRCEKTKKKSKGFTLGDDNWKYSSLLEYMGKRKASLCNLDPILEQFKNCEEYKNYANVNALYMREKKEMEKYWLE
ncbi:MAG TPA: hypothetical protein VK255_01450 [Patescibacteria group bacterium]|nr:hypothetical protein [Patescibacteria group bacterium]